MDHNRKARAARLRLLLIGALSGALLVGGGVWAVSTLGNEEAKAGSPAKETATARRSTSPPSSSPGGNSALTPATAEPLTPLRPRSNRAGIGTGFEHSSLGGESAAITYWQDLDVVDDVTARKQLEAITSRDSRNSIDRRVSDVRGLREHTGLPPSGGAPDGITFTTVVKASVGRSLDDEGDVILVWMVYDRYATKPGKGADDHPLKDQLDYLIVKWEDGDWKLTDEPRYTALAHGPGAYDPESTSAYQEGWREVISG